MTGKVADQGKFKTAYDVVRTAAVPDSNAEVMEGRRRGIQVVKLAEAASGGKAKRLRFRA